MFGFLYKIGRMNSNFASHFGQHLFFGTQNGNGPLAAHHPHDSLATVRPLQSLGRNDRVMYSSTIQLASFAGEQAVVGGGLGGLQRLGRAVVEERENSQSASKESSHLNAVQQQKPLTFRTDRNQRSKMAASSIFPHQHTHNSTPNSWQPVKRLAGMGISKVQSCPMGRQGGERGEEENSAEGEERRKRQINAVKKEVDVLSSRIQHTLAGSGKKEGPERLYFQLPRRNQQQSSQPFLPLPTQQPVAVQSQPLPQHFQLDSQPALKQVSVNQLQTAPSAPQQCVIPYVPEKESPASEVNGQFKKKNVYLNHDLSKQQHYEINKMVTIPPPPNHESAKIAEQAKLLLSIKAEYLPRQFSKADFAIGRRMGKGQFGEVMMVIHRATGFLCGMKVMSKKQIRQQKYSNQIARELSIQFFLTHRFIAPLYGYFQDELNLYLLVEFCTDGQLLQRLRQAHRLEEGETSTILRQVCEGLDYIHRQQIIHRDVKPENILFQMGTVKISDFGWAVHAGNAMRRTVSGTPLYYSPELVLQSEYDEKIDVWSVGLMAYECLLGRIPFKIYSEFDLNRIVSDDVTFPEYVDLTHDAKDFILRALQKKAEERMDIREMLRHPFIAKHRPKWNEEGLQELRRLLSN